jgi:hypothetical protein
VDSDATTTYSADRATNQLFGRLANLKGGSELKETKVAQFKASGQSRGKTKSAIAEVEWKKMFKWKAIVME